ncbi:two-component system sensor histidine kinase NtrB [Treponema brennaborense]|uniref:histidine kinase n=1 Tax=Treponema brennaborense (strain DSM 12168 / CIP 105900 / DD5/3) TaxID=906968 RepID=F4LKY5_TREBD|nr:ATP-binding protein [Treponema brennaborense]AEE16582.1 PAS/PAC sensor signal transduction histidine kinase [Treponema brennaborense DSM 12168]
MTGLVKRVSRKISKLSDEQVEQLFDALSDENEILDAILESLATGLLICDESFRLLQVNKAAERFVPFTGRPADARSQELPVWELISDAELSAFLKSCSTQQRTNICTEFTLETAGGSVRFIEVCLMPLVRKKKLAGNIITVDDVTEQRRQETLLRRMEGLASLTNLAASVAHEIKNPLGSISIHIQLIQKAVKKARESGGTLPDEKFLEKYLNVVTEEIDRLNGIVVDFLFAVRPVNAELLLLDPNVLITQFLEFCMPELTEKHIEVQTELMKDPPKILLDEKLFRQVVLNLIQNAEGAMSGGGMLLVSTQLKNDRFVINIADTGVGMDEKTSARIFEPYFTTKATGTGLGLTMVYKIIKEFSGDIQVQSFPGEGSLFSITLPIPQRERKLLSYHKN